MSDLHHTHTHTHDRDLTALVLPAPQQHRRLNQADLQMLAIVFVLFASPVFALLSLKASLKVEAKIFHVHVPIGICLACLFAQFYLLKAPAALLQAPSSL
ncbi:hypothetical protein CFO_g4906 [Ceratocystis platani]|uniref:Uncharacterized protein n=1 Tax=Ceratocystis fimbriata f. sp. platani TaxID=88771 RepID=A0A0F8AXD0_CERFI|nr:hypothetical protein CFO_g4906 [Ceratocystis platani]